MDIIKKIDIFVESNDNEKLAAADKKMGSLVGMKKKSKKPSQEDSEEEAPK